MSARSPVSRPRLRVFALLLSVLAVASADLAAGQESGAKIHGMTLSTPRGSAEWGRDAIVPAMTDLRGIGVNWVAIHPYAGIDRDGTVSSRRWDRSTEVPPVWITRPIREAHEQGLKILIKPHLAHWGSFSWRGEIAFETPEQWQRFFRTYREWITEVASWVGDADAFAVGTELDKTLEHEAEWRAVVAGVREVYSGPLTYAANWTDYERVPFWDALDAIGIQAYFPVLPRERVAGRVPPQEEFDSGWAAIMERLRVFSARHSRPMVFTELGYNLSAKAPYEPWDFDVGGPNALELQERCMRAALAAIAAEPAVVGAFLWKWFPGDRLPRDFAMASPEMRRVISEYWRTGTE